MSQVSMLDRGEDQGGARGGGGVQAIDPAPGSDNEEVLDLRWDDEDEFVTVRSGGYRVARAVVAMVVLVVISIVLYRGVRGWFDRQLDPPGESGEVVTVIIPTGATAGGIASLLEAEGIVPNSTFFRYYVDWKGEGNFQAGEYEMQLNSSAEEAVAVLNAGPVPQEYARFTVLEGKWVIEEMLPAIAEQLPQVTVEELQAVLDSGELTPSYRPDGVASWEGLLFPSTYEVEDDATARDVLAMMSNEFQDVASELGYGGTELRQSRSAYEIIIIASMVEAEAKTAGDRPKIARVIYNRLQEQMSIDIDATCIYGLRNRQAVLVGDAFDLVPPEYACRSNPNLPATPISSPSRASLEAALNPAEGDWLYYVLADAEGNHFFTADYNEFLVKKEEAQAAGLF
jgi:UPF0755 protein